MEQNKLTLGSLFDGSGGFPLGGILAGIEPIFASEIEPFPILVTHKRLPGVKHYGDVSKLSGTELPPVDIITFGSPCFPEGTLVLTDEGYMPIEEVTVGMKVLTHKGRWKTVTAAGAKYGETVLLKGNHYGLECTKNHPIYSSGEKKFFPQLGNGKRGNYTLLTDKKEWVAAEQMKGRLWAVPHHIDSLPIASPVYSGSWRQKTMPELSDSLFYFVGRWLGDGWVCNGQRSGRPAGETYGKIYLCDSLDKENELISTVRTVTKRYTVCHEKSIVKVSFVSQVFAEWLTDNFGEYASGKRMPGWAFGMPFSYKQSLLKGIIDSDGSPVAGKDNCHRISTISKALAESVRLLAEGLGYSTTVFESVVDKTKKIEGRIVNQHDYYTVAVTKEGRRKHLTDSLHGWYRVRSVYPTHKAKVVYNLTVQDDNSYIADGIVVHNCQDLSIAGKRAGIHGNRSGLFFQAIRIIKEMRDATNGRYPRYCVWENVPGAFSSHGGDDFKAVLEAVIGIKEEGIEVPSPENHRWPKSDVYLGDGWSVAYRVFDAQYWGVPQRRARIYLVADFAGGSAGEVLFKSEGVSGYTPQGFRSWQGTAGGAEESTGETGGRSDVGSGTLCVNCQGTSGVGITEEKALALVAQDHGNHPAVLHAVGIDGYNAAVTDDTAATLGVNCGMSTGRNGVLQAAGFSTEHSAKARSIGYEEEVSPTLRAGVVPAAMELYENHGQDSRFRGPLEVAQPVTATYGMSGNNQPLVVENNPTDGRAKINPDGVFQTLCGRAGTGGNNTPLVAEPVTLKIRCGKPGGGKGAQVTLDKSSTLATNNDQTVFVPFVKGTRPHSADEGQTWKNSEVANTLNTFDVGESRCNELVVDEPEVRAFGVCSKHSNAMMSDNPHSGFYEATTSRTLDQSGGNSVTSNQGGICVVAPAPETFDVRFTSDGTKNARGHCYPTEISRCLDTSEANPDSNHGGIAIVENEPEAYSLQGSMIGRSDKNGPQGSGVNKEVCFTLNCADKHCIAAPAADHYSTSKNSHHTVAAHEQANTLVASDWKDPPLVNDLPNDEPVYIVRRLTPVECARLQGFPDWWCDDLAIPDPNDADIAFWTEVWKTWRQVTNPKGKPKTEKQIRKWLADPYTDSAEYKLWGNGVALPCTYFVLSGIAWAAQRDTQK